MTGAMSRLCALASTRGWRVLVMGDSNAPAPKVRYDTVDVYDGPVGKKKTKLVDREPVVDGWLEAAAARLLDRLTPTDDGA